MTFLFLLVPSQLTLYPEEEAAGQSSALGGLTNRTPLIFTEPVLWPEPCAGCGLSVFLVHRGESWAQRGQHNYTCPGLHSLGEDAARLCSQHPPCAFTWSCTHAVCTWSQIISAPGSFGSQGLARGPAGRRGGHSPRLTGLTLGTVLRGWADEMRGPGKELWVGMTEQDKAPVGPCARANRAIRWWLLCCGEA